MKNIILVLTFMLSIQYINSQEIQVRYNPGQFEFDKDYYNVTDFVPETEYILKVYFTIVQNNDGTHYDPARLPILTQNIDIVFNPHGIFFDYECPEIYVDNTNFFPLGGYAPLTCQLPEIIPFHDDGINIIILVGHGLNYSGFTSNIPGHFIILSGGSSPSKYNVNIESTTIIHEIGHALGLLHLYNGCNQNPFIWGQNDKIINPENYACGNEFRYPWIETAYDCVNYNYGPIDYYECAEHSTNGETAGDYISDTPPSHKYLEIRGVTDTSNDCDFFETEYYNNEDGKPLGYVLIDGNGQEYHPDVTNYMSINKFKECRDHFTSGQVMVMKKFISTHPQLQPFRRSEPDFICECPYVNHLLLESDQPIYWSDVIVQYNLDPDKLENGQINLSGHLIFDEDYHILDAKIILDQLAKITIRNNATLNLENVHLKSCNKYWDGISVINTASLICSENTLIEYAMSAITANKGTSLEIDQTVFNNNWVSIHLAGLYGSPYLNTKTKISNSVFKSDNNFITYFAPEGNDLINLSRPFYGIRIGGQKFVDLSTTNTAKNVFNGLANGIYSINSSFTVNNAVFNDIHPGNEIPAFFDLGYAIQIVNSDPFSFVRNCEIIQCDIGIVSKKSNIIASGNYLNDINTGVFLDQSMFSHIFDNQIFAKDRGIYAFKSGSFPQNIFQQFAIRDNNPIELINENSDAKAVQFAESNYIRFYNNNIGLKSNEVGIQLLNSNGINVKDNTISVLSNHALGTHGIELAGSNGSVLNNNLIDNFDTGIQSGIYSTKSANSTFECNHIWKFNHGMQFWDNCDHSIMKGNTFYANQNDLVLGDINNLGTPDGASWIGPQGNLENLQGNGNKWPFYFSKAHNSGTEFVVGLSPFYVNAHVDPDFQPDVISSAGQWFYNQTNITNLSPCSGNPGSDLPPSCSELISKIMLIDTMSRVESCKKLMWQYKYYQQLIKMKKAGQLSAKCLQFLNAQQNNILVKIAEIHQGVDSIGMLSQGSADALNEVFELSMTLDSLRAAEQTGTPLWEQTMSEYGHAISIYEAIRKMDTQQDSIRTIDLHSKIGRVTVSDSCLAVLLKVFGVKLRLLQQDKLDQRDLSDLSVIAASCPDDLGEGVFLARSMMSLYENTRYPRMEDCVDDRGVTPRNISDEAVTEEKLRVYPNPANDEVTIQIATKKGESGRLSIMNAQGRMMETFETDERNAIIKLNTSHWVNGIYFIEYNNATGDSKELQKLMIVN